MIPNHALRESIEESAELEKRLAELEKENAELEKENAELKKENAELEKKHTFAQTVIRDAREESVKLLKKNAELEQDAELKEKIAVLYNAECDKLRRSMEWTKGTVTAVQENLLEEIEDLKKMLENERESSAESEYVISGWAVANDLEDELCNTRKERDEVTGECHRLRQEVKDMRHLRKNSMECARELSAALTGASALRQKLKLLKKQSAKAEKENAELKAECDEWSRCMLWTKETTVQESLLEEIEDLKMLENEKKLKRKVTWAPDEELVEVR